MEAFASFDPITVLIYGATILLSTLCCVKYDYDKAKGKDNIAWIIAGFVIVWFLLGSSATSGDFYNYTVIFGNSISNPDERIEKLFMLLNKIVRLFTDSFVVFNYIRAGLFIAMVCVSLMLFRKDIYTSIFMLSFTGMYMLESQNFMRTYMSASICFIAVYFLFNKKMIPYFALTVVAFFIHRGSIVMLVPLAFYILVKLVPNRKVWHYILVAGLSFCTLILILHFRYFIFNEKWFPTTYFGVNEESSLGIAAFIYNLPIFVLFILTFFEDYTDQKWRDFSFVGMICSFCLDVISYYTLGIGRMWTYFFPVFGVSASYHLYMGVKHSKWRKLYIAGLVLYVLFLLMRTLIQTEYLVPYGIMPYISVFHN